VKIYLENVYDIFFIIKGLCISLLHIQYTFLYIFFITLFKYYKNVCKEMCTNHDLFFLLVSINLNHNVILYFFCYIVNFILVVNVFLALY
jgi:hypothetical protein